jgi:class 3 adenylate cyclase
MSLSSLFGFGGLPSLDEFPTRPYAMVLSLDKLTAGVDNVRCDALLSPRFCKNAAEVVLRLTAHRMQLEEILSLKVSPNQDRKEFKRLCRDILNEAVNQAKRRQNIQIDYLAQAAVAMFIRQTVTAQFEDLIRRTKNVMWRYDARHGQHHTVSIKLKNELSQFNQQRPAIIADVAKDVFALLSDVHVSDLQPIRDASFGAEALLPDDLFSNPLMYQKTRYDSLFLMDSYDLLLGQRTEDSDRYEQLLTIIKTLLAKIDPNTPISTSKITQAPPPGASQDEASQLVSDPVLDRVLCDTENIDILFNVFKTRARYQRLKANRATRKELYLSRQQARNQKKLLSCFFERFKHLGLINKLTALYEMGPVYKSYCPPLMPHQVITYLLVPRLRKEIAKQLKRLSQFYKTTYPLKPLNKLSQRILRTGTKKRQQYLLRFLKGFARFHRDQMNFTRLNECMERIHLVEQEKLARLSRVNNTLYEFLLPNEDVSEEKPVSGHVILKADVRGSTDMTHSLTDKGLNPASHFSLNFFDPISEILPEYGAEKVFIEGDAVILSVFDQADDPAGSYAVARACGTAINILLIVARHNRKNKKHGLPLLELGIGINYKTGSPTFLFDGDNRIMLSSAINIADRMSGCSKSIRKLAAAQKFPFNLYLFQTLSDATLNSTGDDLYSRYNVNGIELNPAGFEKLDQEIKLNTHKCYLPALQEDPFTIHTGKFPTNSGKYQRLVIRQDRVPRVSSHDLSVRRLTERTYYEVCTHPKVYEYVKQML